MASSWGRFLVGDLKFSMIFFWFRVALPGCGSIRCQSSPWYYKFFKCKSFAHSTNVVSHIVSTTIFLLTPIFPIQTRKQSQIDLREGSEPRVCKRVKSTLLLSYSYIGKKNFVNDEKTRNICDTFSLLLSFLSCFYTTNKA